MGWVCGFGGVVLQLMVGVLGLGVGVWLGVLLTAVLVIVF